MRTDNRGQFSSVECTRLVDMIVTSELCLLLPNRPPTFCDKVDQLRRRRESLPRCLFGPPDPVETERLLKEELQRERERFQRRWNINLDNLEADIAKREEEVNKAKQSDLEQEPESQRIPSEIEVRLSSPSHQKGEEKTTRSSSTTSSMKKTLVCRKSCYKYQKRVRVNGCLKKQTHISDFWRSRRSIAFVLGRAKSKPGQKCVAPPPTPVFD